MSCVISIDSVIGKNPDSSGAIQSAEVIGTTECERVMVYLPVAGNWVEAEFIDNLRYKAVFELSYNEVQVKCGEVVKVKAVCHDNPDCQVEDKLKVECPPSPLAMPIYVSYYDCTDWNSNIEVMNLQNHDATFKITLYKRDGPLVWQHTIKAQAHETIRIYVDKHAPRSEGLAIVEPAKEGWEFPSMLCITNASLPSPLSGIKVEQLQRFVPFIRIPHSGQAGDRAAVR